MLIISASWEMEARGLQVWDKPREKVAMRHYLKNKVQRARGITQVTEHLTT
jgi:hypothetical protein